jgi:hypothetical protein
MEILIPAFYRELCNAMYTLKFKDMKTGRDFDKKVIFEAPLRLRFLITLIRNMSLIFNCVSNKYFEACKVSIVSEGTILEK